MTATLESRLFPPQQGRAARRPVPALVQRFPGAFGSEQAATRFLSLIWFPPSRAWRYQLNGKSGNTFVLNLLFELEFGVPFTCAVGQAETGNQHPDLALFQMPGAGLLANAFQAGDRLKQVLDFPGLTLATVRDPYARALSGYLYLCRSHRLGDARFLPERLRLNALAGHDWERHAGTPEGFDRFLGYLRDTAEAFGAESLDPHWMPQALHIRPEIYRPDLVGRTEDLAPFARDVAERLGRPPIAPERLRRNAREGARADTSAFWTPERRALVAQLYAQDFALFDYDPDAPA